MAPHSQPLVVAALGGAPPTPETGIEGPVVLFASLDALMSAPAGSLCGKIAVVEQRTPRMQDEDAYQVTARARALGPIEAARRGAVAFLLRSIGTDSHRLAHTGSTHYVDGKVPIPAFALSAPDADQLERLAALQRPATVRLFSSAHYVPGAMSQNVVADIPGTDRAGEIVLLGAHLDSWELGTGAIDDGAGDAIIVGAAKLIADLPERPRRTIRVVLYGAEEANEPGGRPLGNHFYVLKHSDEIARHVLTGESDFGADRVYAVSLSDKMANSPFGKAVRDVLSPLGILPASKGPGRGGVDVGPLVEAGVPDFLLEQDGTRYFDIHHTSDDTLDKIDPEQLNQNVAAWAALVWLAADSSTDFRAIEKEAQP
ncbi:MAG: M28 family peptidase [Rhizomicrobium sp.]